MGKRVTLLLLKSPHLQNGENSGILVPCLVQGGGWLSCHWAVSLGLLARPQLSLLLATRWSLTREQPEELLGWGSGPSHWTSVAMSEGHVATRER